MGYYKEHKQNPVNINPMNSRMGGKIIEYQNKLYRIGQNNSSSYGNGVNINLIKKLSINKYDECLIKNINIKNYNGPHTLNFFNDQLIFDFYNHKFHLFAWLNRLRGVLNL